MGVDLDYDCGKRTGKKELKDGSSLECSPGLDENKGTTNHPRNKYCSSQLPQRDVVPGWCGWLSWLEHPLLTDRLRLQFLLRAHT